jgi:hypothetical protein
MICEIQPGVGFIVCRDDVPRRLAGSGGAQARLVGFHVIVPVFPFFDISPAEFPILIRLFEAGEKPLTLLVF